ncbi:UNVERIFIED_CONTAM: hypothetical protein HDU68_012154 [Siphonaria sp. JEL0065]|nr:hypothetical protein HDU68_012154 [Siphonaria sp. JEL0065]
MGGGKGKKARATSASSQSSRTSAISPTQDNSEAGATAAAVFAKRQEVANGIINELKQQNKELSERIQQLLQHEGSEEGISPVSVVDSAYQDETLKAEVENLRGALSQAEAQLKTSNVTAASLGANAAALETKLRQSTANNGALETELKTLKAKLAALQTKLGDEEPKTRADAAHVAQLQDLIRNREVELHNAAIDKEKLHRDLEAKDATIASLRAIIRSLESGVVNVLQGPVAAYWKVGVVSTDLHRFKQDHWTADSSTSTCSQPSCSTKFGVITRKHHCRCCGMIFCGKHSAKKMKLSLASHQYDVNGVETRVCDGCFTAAGW